MMNQNNINNKFTPKILNHSLITKSQRIEFFKNEHDFKLFIYLLRAPLFLTKTNPTLARIISSLF